MKKILCLLLAVMLILPAYSVFAEEDIVLIPGNADFKKEVTISEGKAKNMGRGKYFGYKG